MMRISTLHLETIAVAFAFIGIAGCEASLDRTPKAPTRSDAPQARADAPHWTVGSVWRYRGSTFDSKDNRFYERVLRETHDTQFDGYEVDTPDAVDSVNALTLNPYRTRSKKTGKSSGASTHHPLAFPLGSRITWSTTTTVKTADGETHLTSSSCHVVNYEDITVHAGTFAAFRIDCENNDGFSETWYAPIVQNIVKSRWSGERESQTSELWDYELKPAPPPTPPPAPSDEALPPASPPAVQGSTTP